MLVQEIIQRLRASLETKSVFGAAEFEYARENSSYTESPSFFVVQQTETAVGASEDDAFIINQLVRIVVLVDLQCQDARAERGFFDATKERERIFQAILGQQIGPCSRPVEYVNGALLSSDGRRLFYGYTFNFPIQIDPAEYGELTTGLPIQASLKNGALCK